MVELDQEIDQLEKKLGIPEGFFQKLLEEDDWSFVIKSHAVIESAITHLLVECFNNNSLQDIFSRLELGNRDYGKLAFLKKLELLRDTERRFIKTLSELRNGLVHNIQNINFTFTDYISTLDKNQTDKFKFAFGYAYLEDVDGKLVLLDHEKFFKDPKHSIWLSLKYILGAINLLADSAVLDKRLDETRIKLYEKHLGGTKGMST